MSLYPPTPETVEYTRIPNERQPIKKKGTWESLKEQTSPLSLYCNCCIWSEVLAGKNFTSDVSQYSLA